MNWPCHLHTYPLGARFTAELPRGPSGHFTSRVNPCEPSRVWRVPRGEAVALDEEDVRAFLETSYPRVVNAIALVCGSRAAGEDAVQEALARGWERSDRGLEIESLEAWVAAVALNLARSGLRRRLVERRARRSVAGSGRGMAPIDDRLELRRALATLPLRQREVTVLRYYLDLDVAEVASRIGVTEGTVKTLLYRARRTLLEALQVSEE